MSEVAKETLMSIPPDEFMDIHSHLWSQERMENKEVARFMMRAPTMFYLGCRLAARTSMAGWDEELPVAIRSGWNRLTLSTIDWLNLTSATVEKTETRRWLRDIPHSPISPVNDEEESFVYDDTDPDAVADEAEAQIRQDFPAFAALSSSLEVDLLARGGIRESSTERLGAALAGLAIKRQLSKVEVADLEELFSL